MNINLIRDILIDLYNSDFSEPSQDNPYYNFLYQLTENLPSGTSKIDLDSSFPYQTVGEEPPDWITSLFDNQGNVRPIWNESLQNLWTAIEQYKQRPQGENGEDLREIDIYDEPPFAGINAVNTMTIDDLRYADAGANFNDLLEKSQQMFSEWVKPWENLGGTSYKEERSVDSIFKQIIDDTYLQFTDKYSIDDTHSDGRETIISQIRLLMPKNSRNVFVEDLNRNFWVIGNVIGGICAYLFGSDSPFKDIYGRLVKEIIQLWENALCLWLMASLTILKPCTNIHVELFFLPTSILYPYKTYDNFDEFKDIESNKEEIIRRTVAYADKYSGSNCVMFPCIRQENYEKNYFGLMSIPYVIFIIREGGGEKKVVVQELRYNDKNNLLDISPHAYKMNLWCAKEADLKYYCSYPLGEIPIRRDETQQSHRYYSGLRPTIQIGNKTYSRGNIILDNVTISFEDAIGSAFNFEDLTTISFNYERISSNEQDYIYSTNKEVHLSSALSTEEVLSIVPPLMGKKAYYLGDFPSDFDISVNGKHFTVVSEDKLKTQSMIIKVGQYLPKKYNERTGLMTSAIYNNPDYFNEQVTSSFQITSYHLNYTPNNKSEYSFSGLHLSDSEFYVCDPRNHCFLRSVDLNAKDNPTDTPWSKLKEIGNEVISQYMEEKEINDITYLMAAIGTLPWKNPPTSNPSQGYWVKTVLTHMYRFIPHRLVDFWDKYSISKEEVERYEFNINGEKCYLECLGFVGKIEEAYGGSYNFFFSGTTWRLPELRSYYDNYYNNFLELSDNYDRYSKYYLDMARYPDDSEIKQKYYEAKQAEDWTIFETYISNEYDTYAKDFLPEISVGENISTLAGLWCVYDGNTRPLATEIQPEQVNHLYHDTTFMQYNEDTKVEEERKYREVGNTYLIFKNGEIVLPKEGEDGYITINGEKYWAWSRPLNKQNPTKVNGTYIMQIDNNIIRPDEIIF